jgi:CheY-like chemotaxis protein
MYKPILYAEDDENDVFFMTRALQEAGIANHLQMVRDGREATGYLNGTGPFADRDAYPLPFLVILDLKLPEVGGLEVLAWLRAQSRFRDIHVVVLAFSRDDKNIQKAFELGANSYLVKPPTGATLLELVRILGQEGFDRRAVMARRDEALR